MGHLTIIKVANLENQLENQENEITPQDKIAEEEKQEVPPGEVASLRAEIEKKELEAKTSFDRYLRTLADFENFKKRTQKDQADQARFSNERLIKELLPVIDNLERAIAHSKETADFARMLEGIELICKELHAILAKTGVRPMDAIGKPFDPFFHQSAGQAEIAEGAEGEENRVVGEIQKGYLFHDRVLRPSLVVVSKKKNREEASQ